MNNLRASSAREPEELYVNEWPRFSAKMCPGFLGEFVNLATENSEADAAAVCITALVRFAGEIYGLAPGTGAHVYAGDTPHPPRLFAVICGNSSKSRKGTSRHPVSRFFNQKDSAAYELPEDLPLPARESGGPLSSGEGLAYNVKDETDEEVEEWQRQNPNEPLRDRGDKRLVVIDEEFSAALTCIKRAGNTLSMAMRSFWDDGNYSPLTKSSPIKVQGAHINILGHITTQELTTCFDAVQAANGFGNRFLWVCARRSRLVPLPKRMMDVDLAPLQRELWRVIALAQQRGAFYMTKDTQEMWEAIYPELSAEYPGLAGSLISRGEAQTLRLSLIYALLDGKTKIEESHLESAYYMWRYARDSALYIFSHWANYDPLDEKILNALEKGQLTATELSAALGRNIPKSQLEPALQRLQAQHRIEIRKENRGNNRPTTTISLTHVR